MLEEDDEVIAVEPTDGNHEVILCTRDGMAIRFDEEARPMGRGLRRAGHQLREGDEVVAMDVVGGRHAAHRLRQRLRQTDRDRRVSPQSRGGNGIIKIQTTERNGKVVGIASCTTRTR